MYQLPYVPSKFAGQNDDACEREAGRNVDLSRGAGEKGKPESPRTQIWRNLSGMASFRQIYRFSANEIQQFFHASGQKPIEVADLGADLVIYDVEKHQTYTDSLVCGNQYMETFPTWSPDGKTLYFCRAQGYRQGMPLDSLRYDLCRVQFDAENQKLHTLECVYQASASGHSVSFPRVSPNGEWLMFTQSDYGNFSIWHPESDLYLLNLTNEKVRNINEVNSENVESFHTWSSTGHWFVFSSKRLDGLWARPYFAAFDPETGEAGKPFLLPQKIPFSLTRLPILSTYRS